MFESIEHVLSSYVPQLIGQQRHFSVLIPIILIDQEPHLLYEVRSQNISQPGDTSFPGGAVEKGETFRQAAVRETMEELNLSRQSIKVLGELDYIATEQVLIRSFVAYLPHVAIEDIDVNEEVDQLFTIPLRYILQHEPVYHSLDLSIRHPQDFPFDQLPNGKQYPWRKAQHLIPFYELKDHFLWGYAASFTSQLSLFLKENQLF